MVSSLRYDIPELNDPAFQFNYRTDICSMSSSTIPIIHNPTPYNHHQKEIDMASEYLAMNGTFTDLLATDNEQFMEAYRMMAQPSHATTCSSPASDNYNLFGQKIKMEFEPLEPIYDMARTLSSESCPDLSVCPTSISTPLTPPVDSPQEQSPIMTPILHHNQYHHHHQQQQSPPPQHHIISEEREIMTNQVMMQSQPTTSKRGRGRRTTTNTAMNAGIQLQTPAEFHPLMTSPSLPQKNRKI